MIYQIIDTSDGELLAEHSTEKGAEEFARGYESRNGQEGWPVSVTKIKKVRGNLPAGTPYGRIIHWP